MDKMNVNQDVVRECLKTIINENHLNASSFAVLVGTDTSNFWKKLNGKLNISPNDFRKFQDANINVDYLMTGRGNKYTGPFPKKELVTMSTTPGGVPVYNDDFSLGFLEYPDASNSPIGFAELPGTKNATCWCRASGHSMEPEIDNGDFVCLKLMYDWDEYIPYGDVYAIATTNDMRSIKKITRGEKDDEFTLVSVNTEEYPPQSIKKSSIKALYKVVAVAKIL